MKITCQSCQSKYTVSDEKVQGKTVKIKCRKCGATILVNASGVTTNGGIADPVSTSGGADGSYLVNVTDGDQRNMTTLELVAAYHSGVVTADTYVWADGMADWQPLSQVEALVAALHAGAGAAPEPAAYAPEPAAYAPEPAAYAPAPVYTPEPAAPAYDPGPAYAAQSASPEPPRAAAVRRDPMRRSQDLFGGGMAAQTAHDDVATSAPLFQAPVGGGTGQRDENSTLFSLSALTAKAAVAPSAPRTTATRDDSGLIDLRALAESGPAAQPNNLMPDMGLFPLGAPAIAAPAPALGSIPAPPGKKSPVFIIVGSIVAVAAIVGVFMVVRGGGEKPVPSAEPVAAAPPPPVTAAPTAEPSAAPSANASAEAAAEASAAPSAKAHAGRGGGARGGGARGGAGKGAAGAEAPAAPVKPAGGGKGNCGCASGDLMCAMKCSAK